MICELSQKMPKNDGRTEIQNRIMIVRGDNDASTKQDILELYHFLKYANGNYRNAIFISCTCGCEYMLMGDHDAKPTLFPIQRFFELTGEYPQQDEMCGALSGQSFENMYRRWLLWNTDGTKCPVCSMYEAKKVEV